jgi:hypothetical protein
MMHMSNDNPTPEVFDEVSQIPFNVGDLHNASVVLRRAAEERPLTDNERKISLQVAERLDAFLQPIREATPHIFGEG